MGLTSIDNRQGLRLLYRSVPLRGTVSTTIGIRQPPHTVICSYLKGRARVVSHDGPICVSTRLVSKLQTTLPVSAV